MAQTSSGAAYKKIIEGFPDQCAIGIEAVEKVTLPRSAFDRVVVCGMGGSALGAEFVNAYLDTRPDLLIHRDYGLPNDVSDKTLVVAVSYSGNTEETLDAAEKAFAMGSTVTVMTTGGKLADLAKKHKAPIVTLPAGMPPRLSLGVQVAAFVTLLGKTGVIEEDTEALIEAAAEIAQDRTIAAQGKEIAEAIGERIPMIYAGRLAAVARNWKIKLNETGKVQAFWNVLPEANHNELNAFPDGGNRFHLVTLRDESDHARVLRRLDVTERIAQQNGFGVSRVQAKGSSWLARLLHTVWLGDWVAYAVAEQRGFDPAATPLIEDLKQELGKSA